jgi:hypothetical protein
MEKKILRFIYNNMLFEGMLVYQIGKKENLIQKPIYEFYLNVPFQYQIDKILSYPQVNQQFSYNNEITLDDILKEVIFEVLFYYTYKKELDMFKNKNNEYSKIMRKKLPKVKETVNIWQKDLQEKLNKLGLNDTIVKEINGNIDFLLTDIQLELNLYPYLEEEKKLREKFKKEFNSNEVEIL